MNTLANRQEGRTVGMVGVAAARAFDNRRQADSDTEQDKPNDEQRPHGTACGFHLKRNDQTRHVDQDDCPQDPAAIANFGQTLLDDNRIFAYLLSQWCLLGVVVGHKQ
jgi:hypothetical protein